MASASEIQAGILSRNFTAHAKRRKSAKQQVMDDRKRIKGELLAALAEHSRNIPKDWLHGYNSCRSVIEIYFNGAD